MAGKRIDQLDTYGSVTLNTALKDIMEISKNSGTYGSPIYATDGSRKINIEELASILPLPLNGNAFRLLDLGQNTMIANTFNIIGNPATAPTVSNIYLPAIEQNKMLVVGIGATANPFNVKINGGYKGGPANVPTDFYLTQAGDTYVFVSTSYGWQMIATNVIPIVDLSGLVDTSTTQTVGGQKTFTLSPIFTSVTASTMAFINGSKQLVSALGTTFGTWVNTFTAKTTPVDADTLTLGDSASSFEAKKVTMLQTWDNYYKVKADATYNAVFTISNNVWVDLNNGNDSTGLVKRQDKPFLTLQAGINAIIALGGTDFWQVNILGDFTYTTSALTFTRSNLVIISSGKITNAIPNVNTATSLINFTGDNVEIRLNNYTQTTNQSTLNCSGINNTLFINTAYLKPSKTGQFGIYFNNGVGSKFIGQNIYLDVTNPGITFYAYIIQCRYMQITNLFISGVSSNAINFTEVFDSFIINNIFYTCTYSGTSVIQIVSGASVVRFARVDYMSLNSFTGTHLNTPFFGGEYQMFDLNTVESTHRRLLMSVSASSKVIEFGNILHAGRILENGVGQAFTNIYLGKITLTYITKNEDNAFSLGCGSKLFDGELIVTDTASQPTWGLITWYSLSATKSTCQMNNVTIQYLGDTTSTNYIMTYYASGTNFNLQLANCTFIHKEGNTNGGWIKNHLGNGVNANIKILGTLSLKYNNYTTGTGALLIPSGEIIVDSSLIINN